MAEQRFVKVAKISEVLPGEMTVVRLDPNQILLGPTSRKGLCNQQHVFPQDGPACERQAR
ncbi:MAG: hypothetical protein Ct9H300mP11_18230 [Chloroflexota bacterium]|nr:MAG: hypothetical protein Ct9H300mP11_18230 [Chloroflexota bacterium]